MKFNKDSVLLIVICLAVLFGWEPFCRMMGWTSKKTVGGNTAVQTVPAAQTPAAKPAAAAPKQPAAAASAAVKSVLPCVTIDNGQLALTIDPGRGEVVSLKLLHYKTADNEDLVTLDNRFHAGAFLRLAEYDSSRAWRCIEVIDSRKSDGKYVLKRLMCTASGQEFVLVQQWQLTPGEFTGKYTFDFENRSSEPLVLENLILSGGNLPSWRMLSGDRVRIPSHRIDFMTADGDFEDIDADKKDSKFFVTPAPLVRWACSGNKYFCSILQGSSPFTLWQSRYQAVDPADKEEHPVVAVGAQLGTLALSRNREVSRSFDFSFYAGPKISGALAAFNPETKRVMHLAWGPLDYLARLLLWILVQLHALIGSYGWSIVILTIMVRLLFYPLTARGNASMKKMQMVQPQLKELREKYKDNPQLMNTKMMELYRKEGVNPMSGCLPILLQIPVFFALYAMLDSAVQLRQVPFLWCHNLAAADTVARLNLGFFTLPVNPLVLAMTGLMVLQQHMTPMAMDPTQKKMMAFMPLVMLLFLYDLPSGLTLYWTISNLFSIIQLKLQQRTNTGAVTASASGQSAELSKKE